MQEKKSTLETQQLPLIPLKGLVLFPNIISHFDIGREKSIAALEKAMETDRRVFVVTQHRFDVETPGRSDLYDMGLTLQIKQVLKMPDGVLRVLAEGESRALIMGMGEEEGGIVAKVQPVSSYYEEQNKVEDAAYARIVKKLIKKLAGLRTNTNIDSSNISAERDVGALADFVAWYLFGETEDQQEILDSINVSDRIRKVAAVLSRELEIQTIEKRIQDSTVQQIEQNQKDYFLREKIRSIQAELGDDDANELDDLRERLEKSDMPQEAHDKAARELKRMGYMPQGAPEASVSRSYVEWLLDMPWSVHTAKPINLNKARKVLDADHYGLKEVKERILEYLAVLSLKNDMKGPILCLVGPPGVGKTSIARSVASALGRNFTRMSLGGVRDEAEIRGHRRTYIGAIPGRIATEIKQAESMDPVFLFDEIDKLSSDYRGDPSSAMLEVLDPEQNNTFKDHYLDVPLDLSKVLFLTTANTLDTIPAPLRDRMEVIEIGSYTYQEKVQIAKRYLLAKQLKEHGLEKNQVKISERVLQEIVEGYTREAGVRRLERLLGTICRKIAVKFADGTIAPDASVTVKRNDLHELLGAKIYLHDELEKAPTVGMVNGLAWTAVGGETLPIEVAVMPGNGDIQLTGKLGDVMKESARTALSYIRMHSGEYNLADDFVKKHDLHIHVPEGAVPKDGPSAGVAMTCAMLSAMTGQPARQDVAMTGEVTLLGKVLPIGGVKEKVMAAQRMGIKTVLLPNENAKDLDELPEEVRSKIDIRFMGKASEAIQTVLHY